ncbi:DUF6123 family protein [Sutcliffiella rhizosphaerae]|uniref:Uncharacterized protein n=1 Tax=Sutcliffiella rhizosphaerae TaxID=2880967 RepID=A0ABM8YUV8_9BACI|nr:DUF6123 family protein [Sutcliffiella rhizosphaerae]CAG9623765.1 hypothetical protein BACCIP111883_04599 [Sutcliffiella rhizosphaerae]
MEKSWTTEEYLQHLTAKGFKFGEDSIGFIEFGKHYTGSSDHLVNIAIEITLKAQKEFDGSFFVSFLEMIKKEQVLSKKAAFELAKVKNII